MINRYNKMLPIAGGIAMALLGGCGGGGETKTSAVVEPFYPEPQEEWRLVWSDEFDGTAVDTSNWGFQYGEGADEGLQRWGNNEQQWYTDQNATVADGNLVISAKAEVPEVDGAPVEGFNYTSARMRTLGKFDFKYGRVEARIKAPAGQGLWSAFWMLPSESPYGTWASSGEIDIMEAVNQGTDNSVVAGTLHHGFQWPLNQLSTTQQDVDASDGFHTYSIEWEENEIRWMVDGVHYKTVTSDTYYSVYFDEASGEYVKAPGAAPFNTDFHLLLNLAVGGTLAGEVDTGEGDLVVDYVRVYECSYDLADGSGCNSNKDRNLEPAASQEPYFNSDSLYSDGPATLSWTIAGEEYTRELAASVLWGGIDNGASLIEMDDASRGKVLNFTTTDMGNMGIYAADGDVLKLFGYGNSSAWWEIHAGVLSFDLYIDSSATTQDSQILVKMDSGYPNLGYVSFNVAELPQDQWTTIKVKVNDLLVPPSEEWLGALDTSAVQNIFILESNGMSNVMVDNVALSCSVPADGGCGIQAPVSGTEGALTEIFVNGVVGELWDRGACGYDTTVNGDYCGDGNTDNLITWSVNDSGNADIGSSMLVNYGTNGANGVFFYGSSTGVDISDYEAEGNLVFDLNIPASTVAAGMVWKVDCFYPCSTGDQVLDLTGYEAGTWKTFTFPVSDLKSMGLDLTRVNAGVVFFPTWGSQQGLSFEVANVRYEIAAEEAPVAGDVTYGPADFGGVFGGTTVSDDVYNFPASAEVWGGFANDNADMYPMSFEYGGKVAFTASIPDGGSPTSVRFVFENAPYPDVDPNFSTEAVLVSGAEATYEVEFPAQAAGQTFSSFLMYVVDRDQDVMITNVNVTAYGPPVAMTESAPADFSGVFGGTTVADNVYNFPSGSEVWGGFANDNSDLYPFTFGSGGQVKFTAAIPDGGAPTGVRFVFENAPYPDVDPNFSTEVVTVSGATETIYTVDIPEQAPSQTFSSFLMYIVENDQPVLIKDVVVVTPE